MRTRIILSAIILLLACSVAAADTITACVDASNGALYNVRIGVTPTEPCNNADEVLQWSIVGTQGTAGPQGEPGTSGGSAEFQFVGITTAMFDGSGNGGGRWAMSDACNAEFPGSRIATTDEVFLTVNSPMVTSWAWVFPSGNGTISGLTTANNCYAYSDNHFSVSGMVIIPTGWAIPEPCNEVHPVACSAPVTD